MDSSQKESKSAIMMSFFVAVLLICIRYFIDKQTHTNNDSLPYLNSRVCLVNKAPSLGKVYILSFKLADKT